MPPRLAAWCPLLQAQVLSLSLKSALIIWLVQAPLSLGPEGHSCSRAQIWGGMCLKSLPAAADVDAAADDDVLLLNWCC